MTCKPTLARDIMVSRLITLRPDTDVFDAIDQLLKHQISGAPVVDEAGNFVGVFSERCSISLLLAANYDGAPTNRIEPFMERDVATVTPDTDLLTIAERFLNSNQRRLPVLEAGRLVGQISRRDVLKAAHKLLQQPTPADESNLLYLSGVVERKDAPIA
jgi:CBS domain-containing protein